MNTDPKTCCRAVKSRDARFDGRFFTGVSSTGIFCRPVCPANTPKEENCTFFENAAAALQAGYRPCLRCRPEAAPGGPAWNGVSTTVNRALKLINEGALDEGSVEDLAERLGMGERHLRRLFLEHVGVSPKAVAQTRRVLFAKKLVNETTLPLTEIAHASGFKSVRRFNSTFQNLYGRPPRELRRMNEEEPIASDAPLHLKLALRPPYDGKQVFDFLKNRSVKGIEQVDGFTYRRTLRLDEQAGVVEIVLDPKEQTLALSLHLPDMSHLKNVVERTRLVFDIDADSAAINAHLGHDPMLADSVRKRPGLRVPGCWDPFEIGVRGVLGQQVSVAAARTFANRLVEQFGTPLTSSPFDTLTHLFPSADSLADADLAAIGLTKKRAETLRGLARAFANGEIRLDGAMDAQEAEERLTALPGIGPWTARYICMRGLSEPDAFPSGDMGLLNAVKNAGEQITIRELDKRAERWRPWRAYAALHLWSMLPSKIKQR